MQIKSIMITVILSLAITAPLLAMQLNQKGEANSQKELPERLLKDTAPQANTEWIVRPLTCEEIEAINTRNKREKVAMVQSAYDKILANGGIKARFIVDEETALKMYHEAATKAAQDQCKMQ